MGTSIYIIINSVNFTIANTPNSKNTEFNIFPNPTKKNLTISSNSNGIVQIHNLLGELVYTTIKKENKLNINTSNLSKGIYIVDLNKNIQKLIIE